MLEGTVFLFEMLGRQAWEGSYQLMGAELGLEPSGTLARGLFSALHHPS